MWVAAGVGDEGWHCSIDFSRGYASGEVDSNAPGRGVGDFGGRHKRKERAQIRTAASLLSAGLRFGSAARSLLVMVV